MSSLHRSEPGTKSASAVPGSVLPRRRICSNTTAPPGTARQRAAHQGAVSTATSGNRSFALCLQEGSCVGLI